MTAELVSRAVAVLATATTLSLLSTIVAYAAVNAQPLRWDGSFCAARECSKASAFAAKPLPAKARQAAVSRASAS